MLDCLLNNSTAALITVSIRNLGGNICEEKSPGLLNMAPHWSSKPCMTQVTGVRAPVLEQPTYTWEGDGGEVQLYGIFPGAQTQCITYTTSA